MKTTLILTFLVMTSSTFACKDIVQCSNIFGKVIESCLNSNDFQSLDGKSFHPITETMKVISTKNECEAQTKTFYQKFVNETEMESFFLCSELLACE